MSKNNTRVHRHGHSVYPALRSVHTICVHGSCHGPCPPRRAVSTPREHGCLFDTRVRGAVSKGCVDGPWTRALFWTARVDGPCSRTMDMVPRIRLVCTDLTNREAPRRQSSMASAPLFHFYDDPPLHIYYASCEIVLTFVFSSS